MRAFVAIPLPEEVRAVLVGVREAVLDADPAWRGEKWVAEQNLHITLRFLGNVAEDQAPAIADALDDAVRGVEELELALERVRAMPSMRRATMLWAAFGDSEARAAALSSAVDEATAAWVSEPERKPFRPHATLVRVRKKRALDPMALAAASDVIGDATAAGDASMSVRRVMLVASTLTPGGPVYEELHSSVLGGV